MEPSIFIFAKATTDASVVPAGGIPANASLPIQLILNAVCAALAAMGFGAISNPPKRLLFVAGLLAALGHTLRYFLMTACGFDIVSATLIGAFVIGLGAFVAGQLSGSPSEVFSFPALLPFVPGLKAYYAVLALLRLLRCGGEGIEARHYVYDFFSNALVAGFVLVALVVGASLSVFIDTLSTARRHRSIRFARNKNRSDSRED